jgi:hypothetical protein
MLTVPTSLDQQRHFQTVKVSSLLLHELVTLAHRAQPAQPAHRGKLDPLVLLQLLLDRQDRLDQLDQLAQQVVAEQA